MTSKPIELRQAILDNFDYEDKGREQATDAILDAVITALPEERQREFVLDGGDILSQEGNQRFHRYGGYDSALNNVRHILEQAKELPTIKENK